MAPPVAMTDDHGSDLAARRAFFSSAEQRSAEDAIADDAAGEPTAGTDPADAKATTRPPPQVDTARVAAAVRAGVQSAGLSWLTQAAATSTETAAGAATPQRPAGAPPAPREPPGRAEADVPLVGEPPRHPREIELPVPYGFKWPDFAFICFYEHSGEKREENARVLRAPTCSVADRRSIRPPSDDSWHFIGKVQDFIAVYPHPIRRQSNHVTCGAANWASWRTWPAKILDGSMRRAAEEFLFINCLGDRSVGEQPPTAHQHTVGPPTQTVNGSDFGAPSKTYCLWLRNLPPLTPTDKIPPTLQWSELSVAGSPEAKMVKRSYTPRNLASAEAHAHANAAGGDNSDFGRPAGVPCQEYSTYRKQLAHNFGLLAAHYAPTLGEAWLQTGTRASALILVPVAQCELGACAMVHLRDPARIFGDERDVHQAGATQGENIAAFLTGGIETQYAAPIDAYSHSDAVIVVPWAQPPTWVLRTPEQRAAARDAGWSAAWCTLGALHDHIAYRPVGLAFERIAALASAGAHGAQRAGTWAQARPLISMRTARNWAQSADGDARATAAAREAFIANERQRGDELRKCLAAVDSGDGALVAIADGVRTAADLSAEIPFPANGMPRYDGPALRLQPFAERPLHLDTSWLARLPPQQTPPGFAPMPWTDIVRGWARRWCCEAMNATADRDFECWQHGESGLRRPEYVCIGQGGGKLIPHADGIGSYNALSIVYELDEATGLYDKLDFQRPGRTHWVLNVLKRIFGEHDDHQLMSLIMHGVRWGVHAPMQIRIAANLERMDSRIRGVGAAFSKLISNGLYYKYKKLRRAHERISPDGPGPFIVIPPYIIGSGGTDKVDNPSEKRIVGDQGAPHADQRIRERNHPHGPADGPLVMSMNDMMGPVPGSTPRGQMLDPARYPMPHPETKPNPRQVYGDMAVLSHMAAVNNSYLAGLKDDGRQMFFQFEQSPQEERTCNFQVLLEIPRQGDDGEPMLDTNGQPLMELWYVVIVATCMNMGSRNASKIAQRFTDRLLEGFAQHLDAYVEGQWLPKQSTALRALLAERKRELGPRHSRPFTTSGYTDDFKYVCIGPELLAAGALIWRTMCSKANFWLSAKAGAGTVIDYIGGRLVLNGGYGCLSPTKHARAVADTQSAIDGTISRELLESHNSFMVHVHDWLDFPEGTLKGLSAPLKVPGWPEQIAKIEGGVRDQFCAILGLLHSRRAASFWSGIDEARGSNTRESFQGLIFAPRITSDACSDVARPHICAVAGGLYFRFELAGEWRRRHITLTEACGTALAIMVLGPYFPELELMIESDATSSLSAALATAAAPDLIYMRRRADRVPTYRLAIQRAWTTHCKGWANGLSDAGSRDKMAVMHDLAGAFGMRLREVPIPPGAHEFMSDVLQNTTDLEAPHDAPSTSMGTHNLHMIGNMPVSHGERPPAPRPIDWEESDDDIEDAVNVDRRCERCLHRYFPVRSCHCAAPLIFGAHDGGADQATRPESPAFAPPDSAAEVPSGAAHDTSMGTHNLNMIGNMPVAHEEMLELLQKLGQALQSDAPDEIISRFAAAIAEKAGHVRMRPSTRKAIIAACRATLQRREYPSVEAAAAASGSTARLTYTWKATIAEAMRADKAATAVAEHVAASGADQLSMLASNGDRPVSGAASSGSTSALPDASPAAPCAAAREVTCVNAAAGSADAALPIAIAFPIQATAASSHVTAAAAAAAACAVTEAAAAEGLALLAAAHAADEAPSPGAPPPDAPPTSAPPSPPDADDLTLDDVLDWWGGLPARPPQREPQQPTTVRSLMLMHDMSAALMGGAPADDVPTPQEARDFMYDVADWAAYVAEPEARHSTSRGRHNLSMIGNMPISHDGVEPSPEPLRRPRACRDARRRSPPSRDGPRGVEHSPALGPAAGAAARNATAWNAEISPEPVHGGQSHRRWARAAASMQLTPASTLQQIMQSPEVHHPEARSSPRLARPSMSTAAFDDAIGVCDTQRSRSPQPSTAAEARRIGARDVAARLTAHDSQYALCPGQPGALTGVVTDASAARDAGIPHGTAEQDEWGFKWVKRFCEATGNVIMRPRAMRNAVDTLCEVWFTILALAWISQAMPASKRRQADGYEQGMPTSALQAIYAHRRVMRDCGRCMPDLAETRAVLKGLCSRYKTRWGDEAFVPQRKQPFSSAHLLAIVAALATPAALPTWTFALRIAVLTAFCHAISTGARKDEWTASFAGDTFARRANFAWVEERGGEMRELPSTPDVIASRRNGHLLRGRSAPSKCDRLNIEWGSRDMYFRYDDTNPLNLAWRWQQWELAFPCPECERRRWPAFSPTGDATPFTGGRADSCLNVLLALVMSPADAARRTWHSCRVTLATRLFARRGRRSGPETIEIGSIEGVIQSLVRWKTPEAMRIYARMEPAQYADYVDMATNANRQIYDDSVPDDLPETDPAGVVAEHTATIAALDAEVARAAKAKRAARDGGTRAAATGNASKRRRPTPTSGDTSANSAEPPTVARVFDIGDGIAVAHAGEETWHVIGQELSLHYSFWQLPEDEYSPASVVGFVDQHTFPNGRRSKHAYVVECEGNYYLATHTTVAGALVDDAVKRRVKKAPPPRLIQ